LREKVNYYQFKNCKNTCKKKTPDEEEEEEEEEASLIIDETV